jgi:membrane protein DedA with SNARE-associated domain
VIPLPSAFLVPAFLISGRQIDHLLGRWGYWLVFAIVLLQSSGVPLPGTTALAAAAIYAGGTHRLAILGVVAAAAAGATLGYVVSFALGRWGGWRLLENYGYRLRLTPDRLELGRQFYARHGGKVLFLGRFVTGLRTWGGLLAGANLVPWLRFLVIDAAGGIAWAVANGLGYFYFGDVVSNASTGVDILLAIAGIVSFVVTVTYLRRRAGELTPKSATPRKRGGNARGEESPSRCRPEGGA